MTTYEYISNNSGGDWWLSDEDWIALDKAGWNVEWGAYDFDLHIHTSQNAEEAKDNRYLGALAKSASKAFASEDDAISEFEEITGQDFNATGCMCCGEPHGMYERTV